MKIFILLVSVFFISFTSNCTSQNKNEIKPDNSKFTLKQFKIEKIQLTEQTRGTNRIITFTSNSKIVSLNGENTTFPLSSEEWQNISVQVNLVDLSKISSYESPTTDRFSDMALASSIIITSDGKQYTSNSFDAGMPPKELEALYDVLNNGIIKKKPEAGSR
ncbi:hypothetical protein [Chryseobacterium sp. FH2]|uniref:hypothetical protein n=1 Tax=Chryseobacterium sp. FH2 TaxID=1674291 RepID=UPI00065AAEEB|nr:hypothetical protein [Chryseobacterium sp. FH2]